MDIITFLGQITDYNLEQIADDLMNELRNKKAYDNKENIQLSYLKTLISRYRKSIDNSNLSENQKTRLKKIIKLTSDEYQQINLAFDKNLTSKLINRIEIDSDKLIDRAIDLLDSKFYTYRTTGLTLLTGRRPNEILLNGNFNYATDIDLAIEQAKELLQDRKYQSVNSPENIFEIMENYHNADDLENGSYILFSGQSKQSDTDGNRLQPYPIPVLYWDNEIIESIDSVRIQTNFKEKLSLTENDLKKGIDVNKKLDMTCNKSLNEVCRKIFKDLIPEKKCSMSELRAIYQTICYEINHGPSSKINQNVYCSAILGHRESSKSASLSYMDYVCI